MGGLARAKQRLALPVKDDAEYIRGIETYRKMVDRAPPFSRPALLHRAITGPDQVFGPVGSMKGRVFSDPGFMSATTDPNTAENYGGYTGTPGKMVLHVPAGGGGMRSELRFSKDHVREKEYTFAPGTKWRVDSDRIVGGVADRRHAGGAGRRQAGTGAQAGQVGCPEPYGVGAIPRLPV